MQDPKIRIDFLHNHPDYKVAQHEDMYHFNTDTCLLGEYITIKENENVLDIGTNNGALLVYILKKGGKATGIEINEQAIDICKMTLQINNLVADVILADFTTYRFKQKFDVVVTNPPFFNSKDEKEKNKNSHKSLARHEETLDPNMLSKGIANCLKENGRVYIVYRYNRLDELEKYLNLYGLYINEYQVVIIKEKRICKNVLITASFNNIIKKRIDDLFI